MSGDTKRILAITGGGRLVRIHARWALSDASSF